nr:photosystem I assembly protein Ycf33 [Cryptomonas borealis]
MSDFWENIERFPRFFVSSTLGLILIIIGPCLNLTKRPKTALILFLSTGMLVFLLTFILTTMLGLDAT